MDATHEIPSPRQMALFSYGFRPFFLGGALWAAVAMALWIGMLSGALELTTQLDPVSWHAHEFLFGYLSAVIAGFLLTAVPNWTNRAPLSGSPLAGLFILWAAGRTAIALGSWLNPLFVAVVDLSFLPVLAMIVAREIIAGRNWRNLIVLALLGVFISANTTFHVGQINDTYDAQELGLRIGLVAAILLVALIGGRIVPAFTRNWLKKRGAERLPTPPMQRFDIGAMVMLLVACALWSLAPEAAITGVALGFAGLAHSVRLLRWQGGQTGAEPLLWILHMAYGFVPLGSFAMAGSILWPDMLSANAAQHMWMAGAIGLMTLAVMTRATLGHTGAALHADLRTLTLYLCLLSSIACRVLAGLLPDFTASLHSASGILWISAFAGFALIYGPRILRTRNGN
ncbi:NnrS family protein [Pacificoceanicola onchidii]|uniref:NnrS family protein n=1 Tax=Pacificoceanicola onchidii TaxID=2562685 RepID=UPI0010A5BD80|nr:NnrS family protein [Pacificoceanicola onchidii]